MSQSNKMSVMQLTILTAVNMMGSGIIMLPTKLAQVGALSIVSWLLTAVGSMCGSLVGIFVGALAVNASLGYMILLLGAWGLCLYITSRSLMDDARREEAVLNQPTEEFDDPDELPPLYWEGYDRGYEEALESMAYTRPPRVRPPKSKKKGA